MSSRIPKYVSSFAIGAAVGAGLALLFAPMPGRKMQKRVSNLAEKVVDDGLRAARRMAS
jgi:gas vesicle protein